MSLLADRAWKAKYKSGRDDLLRDFYEPALSAATRYDRATGFFGARVLTMASLGVEGLVRNQGHWRLVVGCQLKVEEVDAIERGLDPAEAVALRLAEMPLMAESDEEAEALELLSWLIARGTFEIRFAIPCDADRRPLADGGMFHEKAGIVEDKTGDRLAFNGSVNETPSGWGRNWESFHAFASWSGPDGQARVAAEEQSFRELWENEAPHCLVVDLPDAVRDDLLRFLPADDQLPRRLQGGDDATAPKPTIDVAPPSGGPSAQDLRSLVWALIAHGATFADGGDRVGEATSIVTPWPHQVHAFERMYRQWPPRLLIADEVGLGKTIEAGLVLRQAWMAGRLNRVLIMAPKNVCPQWQSELREKFNLDWPIYDGTALQWFKSRGRSAPTRAVSDRDWHKEPFVIVSSHLMRRAIRAKELSEGAAPWDLVVLDEAHHARRKGGGLTRDRKPNRLLELMQHLKDRTQGLLLLTATPMQVHPKEVWDLLSLLRMPAAWHDDAFVRFFETAALPNPSVEQFEEMAQLFQAAENEFGQIDVGVAARCVNGGSRLAAKKVLAALRDSAVTERKRLEVDRRRAAIRIMQAASPVTRLISRHTRELLRKYFREGRISTPVPDRRVQDVFIDLSAAERAVYEQVERYISTTYNAADPEHRNAIGFVMTIYRRRLSSSFQALSETLADRIKSIERPNALPEMWDEDVESEEDTAEEPEDVEAMDIHLIAANEVEERSSIAGILEAVRALPPDTKIGVLIDHLAQLRDHGRGQVMVFTQYTDTLDCLRDRLVAAGYRVLCFSGRGGERQAPGGRWSGVSREETKRLFSRGEADILLCTDAAAEGLNFQFCGALVNYDMPWNPMRVEQRIGRIDRLGQRFPDIRIVNLHYENTVETDIYRALRERIGLFEKVVGKLQPILAAVPKAIAQAALTGKRPTVDGGPGDPANILANVQAAEDAAFDLDELTAAGVDEGARRAPVYDLEFLEAVLMRPDLLPSGAKARLLGGGEFEYWQPGMTEPLRVTTNSAYYDEHPDSVALWSPGSPLFPQPEFSGEREGVESRSAEIVRAVRSEQAGA